MRRVIAFCLWKADWWDAQANRRIQNAPSDVTTSLSGSATASSSSPAISETLQDGLRAYAAEHAAMERSMAAHLEKKWEGVRDKAMHVAAALDSGAEQPNDPETDSDFEDTKDTPTVVEINLNLDDDDDDDDE
jgi:hypothetical protein